MIKIRSEECVWLDFRIFLKFPQSFASPQKNKLKNTVLDLK